MENKKNTLILGIDLEGINQDLPGSGVNLKVDRITEIGAVLWDTKLRQPVKIFSELIDEADHLPISEELLELTGISEEMLKLYGAKGEEIHLILDNLTKLINKADYLMAHNAKGYDRPMLEELFKRYGKSLPSKTWIDTFMDVEYPKKITQRSMAMLEHSHGFINPFPHRAVTDVMAMLKIIDNYDIDRMVALAKSPIIKIIAELDAPNWRDKQEVNAFNKIKHKVARARFKWNPDNKTWFKEVHKLLVDEGKINYDFDWYPIE